MKQIANYFSSGIISLFLVINAQAQEVQKLYHPNGTISFEGQYSMTWTETEPFEIVNPAVTDDELFANKKERRSRRENWYLYKNVVPSRSYEGLCKFYYSNGNLKAEGTFKNGLKNGAFKLYHKNGKLAAHRSYIDGMADGTWESWDEEGFPEFKGAYRPIPQDVMTELLQFATSENERSGTSREYQALLEKVQTERKIRRTFSYYQNPVLVYHQAHLNTIIDVLENYNLYSKGFKEGRFTIWKRSEIFMDMDFKDNGPVGKWTLYKSGKPAFELTIEKDSVVHARDLDHPENNYGTAKYKARQKREEEERRSVEQEINAMGLSNTGMSGPPPTDKVSNEDDKIFKIVQQQPTAGYDWVNYLKTNIKYPDAARKASVEGRVIVAFVVERDGSVTNVKVVRGRDLGHGLPEEALRVVKAAPKWRPAKHDGKTVRCAMTVPVDIKKK